jgi:ankyrin repeat protein
MLAAEAGKIDAARTLIEHKADVNATTSENPGRTALDLARANWHDDIVDALAAARGHGGLPQQ